MAGFLSALPAIANIASSFFGKKKKRGSTVPGQTVLPPFQVKAGQDVGNFVNQFLSQYTPGKEFSGDTSVIGAPSGFESQGFGLLADYLSNPATGEAFDVGKQNIIDTLGGKFADPGQSPYIKSLVNLSNINLRDAIDATRARRGARGNFFTSEGLTEERELQDRTLAGLNAAVGDFINQERNRQVTLTPLARSFDEYENVTAPLAKVGATQTYGALPRVLQGAQLEFEYQDFKRKQGELGKVPNAAQNLYGTNAPYVPSFREPDIESNSTLSNILDIISRLNLGALKGPGSIFDKIPKVVYPGAA